MQKLYTESLRRPTRLDPSVDYMIPLISSTPVQPDTTGESVCYRSTPSDSGPYPESALLVVIRSTVMIPFMAVRIYGYRQHSVFASQRTSPQYVYDKASGLDRIEMTPSCLSTNSGASVFVVAVADKWSLFSVGLFHDAESFSVFALSASDVASYRITPVAIESPYQEADVVDPYITDDFEGT